MEKKSVVLEAEKWQNSQQVFDLAEGLYWMKLQLSESAVLAGTLPVPWGRAGQDHAKGNVQKVCAGMKAQVTVVCSVYYILALYAGLCCT